MNAAVFTSSALSLPISFCKTRSSQVTRKKGEFRVFAVFGEDSGLVEKKNQWGHLFDVEDPRSKTPPPPYKGKGKFMDVNQALEVARLDIQYLDWRARQDLLTIMLLHDKVCFSPQYLSSTLTSQHITPHRSSGSCGRRVMQRSLITRRSRRWK
ncbi:PREDICTED: chlorophyllide a oxygenase, chloroplastic-like [Brassica oleracea var. oleracea]|uniref:chlorophyllide a oxygenase, chloroplastic-like n=1 Tax=Brassica oleracea var. oleracea TaxID=109376 RepID=UPI0006A70255|nr:PREDICTED: chlorophyllide a oxygenase, chloroplastic-like [Brassica oleracea var. oleracea]